jgi:branched-subunit amino acid ABC-type transport system permease component
MQIEEAFCDLKCARFGLGLEQHECKQIARLAILSLIAMLALLVAWFIGKALELTGRHRDYQANSVRHRTVLSTIFLGLRVIETRRTTFAAHNIDAAVRHLLQQISDFHAQA